MQEETNIPERISNWMKHSITLKLISITVLILLLLIPSSMIQTIIQERETLGQEVLKEVNSKWANAQLIKGPILSIPMVYEVEKDEKPTELIRYLNILPEDLEISGKVSPQQLKRGIYELVVYKSDLNLSGTFSVNHKIDRHQLKEIKWEEAFLTIGISDLRGIKDNIEVLWNDQKIKAEPGSKIREIVPSGVTVNLPDLINSDMKVIHFAFKLDLQGSENLSFIPLGRTTNVNITSDWNSPSFNGNFLPNRRDISESSFSASWKILELNRNFPQSWIGNQYSNPLNEAAFGVDLILPLDDYQKSMRSAKYAILTIALTFLIFFLVEVMHGRKIHAFQYTLVGLSLCLFYVLLISISEHSNFNLAYGISTVAIISMISLYSLSVFRVRRISGLLVAVLCGVYGFVFVTLQLEDYALLLGAIGLTVILGATMYFTRNVDWYQLKTES
ncbi:cell envelope integrity protein CreD [Marinoscillum sp.]|uniref:cell envelope integrity protein CreD n=1 Tax=Marinoscillum sp. TaxID=2024838 RepID=UPI003BA8C87B